VRRKSWIVHQIAFSSLDSFFFTAPLAVAILRISSSTLATFERIVSFAYGRSPLAGRARFDRKVLSVSGQNLVGLPAREASQNTP
jgi:hypothetical protein